MFEQPILFAYLLLRYRVFLSNPFPEQSVRLILVTYPSLCRTCMTYAHDAITLVIKCVPLNPYPVKRGISLGVTRMLSMCLTYFIGFSPKAYYMIASVYGLELASHEILSFAEHYIHFLLVLNSLIDSFKY